MLSNELVAWLKVFAVEVMCSNISFPNITKINIIHINLLSILQHQIGSALVGYMGLFRVYKEIKKKQVSKI